MKTKTVLTIAILCLIAIPGLTQVNQHAQLSPASQDIQQSKDLLVDAMGQLKTVTTAYTNLDYGVQVFTQQLSKIRTIPQLDSLRTARQIPNPEPLPNKSEQQPKPAAKSKP